MKAPTPVADVQTAFREAMRGIASTVSIVTAGDRNRGHGMTATAMTSLSFDPPALLVCINRKTLLHDIISSTGRFCVNVLAQQHRAISDAFSGAVAPHERFSMGDWSETEEGLKYLTSAQARIFCVKKLAIPFGTHTIFVGEVGNVQISENNAPLLYQNSTYCSSTPVGAP